MSISNALYTSFYGLRNTEQRIGVTSQNVTNADKPGYTRKELQSTYNTTNAGTVPTGGEIATVNYNKFLLESLIEDSSIANMQSIISDYMAYYSNELGSTDGKNSLSAYLDNFSASLDQLTLSPEDTSLKNQVISNADRVAIELNRLSTSIQDYRLTADHEIETTVNQINTITATLEQLNDQIVQSEFLGRSTADLVDQRYDSLEQLSQLIDFDYFVNSNNSLQIYSGGVPLLDSRAHPIDYTANTNLDKNTLYPSGFNAIDVNGFDITTAVSGGKLAGLIEMRDTKMVEEQSKLDEFASVLITQMNALLNQGASVPPRSTMIGELDALTAGTPLGGTGLVRIATTDSDGIIQNGVDLNLAAYASVGAMIAGINAALGPDVTASLTVTGQLSLVANNSGEGVSINSMTSNFSTTEGFSDYFGLNNLYDGTGADDIQVSQYVLNSGQYLATSRLSGNGLLVIGSVGVNIGDSSLSLEMHNAISTSYSFNAAGNFSAQSDSLDNYIDKIISDVAYRSKNAETDATISQSLMDQTKSTLQNLSGVNIDEEMATLVDLEAKYAASATMISTLKDMFDTLLGAVR